MLKFAKYGPYRPCGGFADRLLVYFVVIFKLLVGDIAFRFNGKCDLLINRIVLIAGELT